MDPTRLKQINDEKARKVQATNQHLDTLAGFSSVQNTILNSTMSLIKYLEGHTTKTEVINQLQSVNTPDSLRVIPYIESLHETLKTHRNTDLTEITSVMNAILEQAKLLPKTLPEEKEQKFVDYSKQFKSLIDAVQGLEKVVKQQELVAEAPVVNVPETNVHVDAPDLKPLQNGFKDVVSAVESIVIPEYKTDNTAVEKLLKDTNKLLDKLLAKPISSGGGGGSSRATPYEVNGVPTFVNLNDGRIPTYEGYRTNRYDYANSTAIYVGDAPIGTLDSQNLWTITYFDLSDKSNASGKIATNVSWTNRSTGTYV